MCPLATSTTLNSRNRTNLPVQVRHKDEPSPTHRSIQDANYHNQIVKERSGAPLPGQGSTRRFLRQTAEAARHNRQGPNSFCLGTRSCAYLQSNPASGYLGLRFFTARLTSNPSRLAPFIGNRRQEGHATSSWFAGQLGEKFSARDFPFTEWLTLILSLRKR